MSVLKALESLQIKLPSKEEFYGLILGDSDKD